MEKEMFLAISMSLFTAKLRSSLALCFRKAWPEPGWEQRAGTSLHWEVASKVEWNLDLILWWQYHHRGDE